MYTFTTADPVSQQQNGGKVRRGVELDSQEVTMLPRDTVVQVEREEGERVLISSPCVGWLSAKVLSHRLRPSAAAAAAPSAVADST